MKAEFDKAKQYLKSKGICFGTRITAGKIAKHMEGYANEVSREKCDGCVFSYHDKKSKGYHDVEEYYKDNKEQEEQPWKQKI